MISRRRFIQSSSIVSLAPMVPQVFASAAAASTPGSDEKILVVIQLDGGNDGLNTVVPYADDNYAKARKKLRIPTDKVLGINDELGLHPAMKSAKQLFDDGLLSIVQGVGYPNPDRSHFRSMRIWQTASFDDDKHDQEGWLGKALDHSSFTGAKDCVYVGRQETPVSLWSRRSNATSIASAQDLELVDPRAAAAVDRLPNSSQTELEQFVSKQVLSAYTSAKEMGNIKTKQSTTAYPRTRLGSQLELIGKLLKSSSKTRIYYTTQYGFDTHSNQLYAHTSLLRDYSKALKAFLDELKHAGLSDRVVVMTFSEFGRRVHENDSAGTDHGTAGPVFLAGESVKAGLLGSAPDLSKLNDGDLAVQYDFRQVYATILDQWLGVDADSILGGKHERLPLLRT